MTLRVLLATALLLLAVPGNAQAPDKPVTRIAFGSCANEEMPQPIWDAVLAYKPDVFVFAGDNVYGDHGRKGMDGLRDAYAAARRIAGYEAVRRTVPTVLATWDDHDYGPNDGGAEFADKAASQALFADFWELPPDDPRRARAGLYHAVVQGPPGMRVQTILLDTRSFRSALKPTDERNAQGKERYLPDPDPAKTMLGDAQWRWLEERLREPAELRLLVSSIQVVADGHGWERWGNLPAERKRLYDLIAATRANGVVFLSGDRHVGALYRETDGVPYPLTEITSSGINMVYPAAVEDGPNRLGALYGLENFGTVDVDWWAGTVTLGLAALNGAPVRRETLRLADLAPR